MSEIKPIRPEEIIDQLEKIIPQVVIEAVNNLLKKKYRGLEKSFNVKEKEIIEEIMRLDSDMIREDLYKNHWLDFEEIYRNNGWKVEYDKPHYTDNYDAYFTFTVKK